ncbi:MAG: hypothetical protein NTY15_15020 [Planctomycetota bacterium]|nr:hypothetical protein [Planctomycetota bacterium]
MTKDHLKIKSKILLLIPEAMSYCALGGVCLLVTWMLTLDGAIPDYAYLALSVCLATGLGPLAWQLSGKALVRDELSILLTMGFRVSVLLGSIDPTSSPELA